ASHLYLVQQTVTDRQVSDLPVRFHATRLLCVSSRRKPQHPTCAPEVEIVLLSHKFARLLTTVTLTVLAISLLALPAAAKSRKGKAVASQSKVKSSKQAKAVGQHLSRREATRRGKRGRHSAISDLANNDTNETIANHSIVPDRIEVLEYGSTSSADTSRWLTPTTPRKLVADPATQALAPSRGKKISIDSERAIQIQHALAARGLYSGETTGIYDSATIEAMRRFQINNKISVTGYPTAHSLKRLGLGNW
ncbi:MAG: peptidoglycan-binding domain-containing protein, partial [Blastocatellia bacterium]